MTNFEKIKSELTVEKVANFIATHFKSCYRCPLDRNGSCDHHKLCVVNLKEWLESEVEEE